MSEEDVNKLKRPEQLDYNLDVLFVSLNCALYRTKEVNFTFPKTLRNKSRHETVIKRSSLVANPTESQAQRNRRQKNLMMQKCLTSLCFSWWIFWTSLIYLTHSFSSQDNLSLEFSMDPFAMSLILPLTVGAMTASTQT